MKEKTQYCVNHPDVVAAGNCDRCEKAICYHCSVHVFKRSFCSLKCLGLYLLRNVLSGIWSVMKAAARGLNRLTRSLFAPPQKHWIELLLAIAVIVCFYYYLSMRNELRSMKREAGRIGSSSADTSRVIPPKVFEPVEGGMVHSSEIDINGEAEANRIVSLSINGKLERVTLPRDGLFVFEGVKIRRGSNRIEVRAISESGQVSTLQTLMISFASPSLEYLSRDFRRGPSGKNLVALTFDGGAENNAADEILDILRQEDVQSTFFLTGAFMRTYPETVKRIVEEGHEVGNHTWSHPHLTSYGTDRKHHTLDKVTSEFLKSELVKTRELFELVSGQKMTHFWRAPYGEQNADILRWAAHAGYKHVGWTSGASWEETMDTMDWIADKNARGYHTAEEISRKILSYDKDRKNGANGMIILMHLGTNRQDDFPHLKLPEIINGMRDKGYRWARISEMVEP